MALDEYLLLHGAIVEVYDAFADLHFFIELIHAVNRHVGVHEGFRLVVAYIYLHGGAIVRAFTWLLDSVKLTRLHLTAVDHLKLLKQLGIQVISGLVINTIHSVMFVNTQIINDESCLRYSMYE